MFGYPTKPPKIISTLFYSKLVVSLLILVKQWRKIRSFVNQIDSFMNTIPEIEKLRSELETSLYKLIRTIGPIQIGTPKQFPYGWRKSAKGRTVWRILEEVITQNLELRHQSFGIADVHPADSEVGVYDMSCAFNNMPTAYINIKSAVVGGKASKDDISKAAGLLEFYEEDPNRNFFVATFFIDFNPKMYIEIVKVSVFPIAWIPDVYVNPSNNGNLQSSHYKDISEAVQRTNKEFLPLLLQAYKVARVKRRKKDNE